MRFVNLSLSSTGDVLRSELVRPADLDPSGLRSCRSLLAVTPTKSQLTVPGWEDLLLQQTLARGQGLATVWKGPAVASSAVLLAGTDAVAEAELLHLFHESIARMHARVVPGAQEAPFVEFHIEERRPAVFQVIWPAVAQEDIARIEAVATHFAAAFLDALGIARDAGDG